MLEELQIRDLGPIRSAVLTPAAGMTAITGETGAGKSMLLSAIRLISGGPADAGRVSADASQAWAQGVFAVADDAAAAEAAREAGADPEDGELFLARTVPASGRSRAVLNGKSVPRSVLAQVADGLVTVHGQSDQLRIASSARQREFLDMVAGDRAELDAYRRAWEALRAVDGRLERLERQEASMRQQADYLRESIERINRVDPQPGEDDELKARRSRIENAAEIAQGVSGALAALDATAMGDPDARGACDMITHAVQSLRAIRVDGMFEDTADRLESINADLADVVFTLSRQIDGEESVDDLDAINGRIHELGELTRRWGPTLADVIAWRDKAALDVEDLDASPEKLAELRRERDRLFDEALRAARALSAARAAAAASLSGRVGEELASLAMAGAALDIEVTPRDADGRRPKAGAADAATWPLDAHGCDDIAFLFTPFPGSPKLPMGTSASGGELSRLMLALELVAAERRTGDGAGAGAPPMTFIFDEVDAGVGGKSAVELGRRLARLARSAQVIVVTHLAQVASWADAQFVVSKDGGDQGVATGVREVRGVEREREIARMLSGSESEASLGHARELLADSRLD
ncbi:DNA repair protein RecN [Bifidobacterium phasiani]|uniref:DNA repair protein RecN n=1 Tax=Bifidobacterium phasiani TaxID=2834431 RepID=A0ABS6W8P5_9BIFI|nr:DNA repair protein RecN [Bifidobacterium phasiani]MBW3082873.1 DNA repair protein RecN [Bifidobacterium phasiani]